jgi:hypothetical protein
MTDVIRSGDHEVIHDAEQQRAAQGGGNHQGAAARVGIHPAETYQRPQCDDHGDL